MENLTIEAARMLAPGAAKHTKDGRDAHGERLDCAVRAFAVASGETYERTRELFAKCGRKPRRRTPWAVSTKAAEALGLAWVPFSRPITWARVRLLMGAHVQPRAYLKRGHLFAAIAGVVADFERVGPRSRIVGYYVKRGEAA